MNTRDIAGLLQGHWRTCGAVGCGCLSVIMAGAALAICPLLFGVATLFGPATPTAPTVVRPVMLSSHNAVALPGNSNSQPESNRAVEQYQGATLTDQPLQPYMPYEADQTWADSTAGRAGYLGWANLAGARRTPYSRGQVMTYPNGATYTIVTADFDFTLLQDPQGREWYCPANIDTIESLNYCQQWQRGKF